jgi:hypothetical protein
MWRDSCWLMWSAVLRIAGLIFSNFIIEAFVVD